MADLRSERRRPAAEKQLLADHGGSAWVCELHGDLRFATVEPVLHRIVDENPTLRCAVLDFKPVTHVDAVATRMQLELERPALALQLLRNLLQRTMDTAAQLTGEVAALEG